MIYRRPVGARPRRWTATIQNRLYDASAQWASVASLDDARTVGNRFCVHTTVIHAPFGWLPVIRGHSLSGEHSPGWKVGHPRAPPKVSSYCNLFPLDHAAKHRDMCGRVSRSHSGNLRRKPSPRTGRCLSVGVFVHACLAGPTPLAPVGDHIGRLCGPPRVSCSASWRSRSECSETPNDEPSRNVFVRCWQCERQRVSGRGHAEMTSFACPHDPSRGLRSRSWHLDEHLMIVWRAWANHKTEPSVTSHVRGRIPGEFSPITEVTNGISSHRKERSQHKFVYTCTLVRSNELTLSQSIPFWSSHVSRIYPWYLSHTISRTESPICSQKIRYW